MDKMSDKTFSKWLTGCGIGCGVLVVIAIGVGLTIFMYTRNAVQEFKEIGESVSRVDKQFGRVEDYAPEPDGRIPADRVEAFLAVRKATTPARGELAKSIHTLESEIGGPNGQRGGFWHAMRAARTGVGAVPQIARFHKARADAQLENRMGHGEYSYIYCLAYYSWLKKDPGDGPEKLRLGSNNNVTFGNHDGGTDDTREQTRQAVMSFVRRYMRPMLRNAVRQQAEKSPKAEKTAWQQTVEKEIAKLESEWQRIPWSDGLPPEIQESFEPFKADLEESYDPLLNILELMPVEKHK